MKNMSYKILYVEDLNPETKIAEFKQFGYVIEVLKPLSLEDTIDKIINGDYDALVFDYKLTANREKSANKLYNAPTLAQTIRTMGISMPIILLSSQKIITEAFDLDYTSQDLFDFCVSKEMFSKCTLKYCERINAFIEAYKKIDLHSHKLQSALNIESSVYKNIDYRLKEIFEQPQVKNNTYAFCRFIHYEVIRSIGALIGEDVLSSRLGVSKKSQDWAKLLDKLDEYKYKGILSDVYDRWWWNSIDIWWQSISPIKSLRQLSSTERTEILIEKLGLPNLNPLIPCKYAYSDMFWTICKETHIPIDPNIDGFDINQKKNHPWQEKEYISAYGTLEVNPRWMKQLNKLDKQVIKSIASNINNRND